MVKCQLAVNNGLTYLKVVCPTLISKINVDTLDMSNTRLCILGQLYGNYHEGARKLNLLNYCDIVFFGFNIDRVCDYTLKDLEYEWKLVLSTIKE